MKTFFKLMTVLAGLLFYTCNSFGACVVSGSGITGYMNAGNIIVQRDAPIGSVLKTVYSNSTSGTYDICTNGGYEYTQFTYPGAAPTGIAGVLSTNIPGIGIRAQYNTLTPTANYIPGNSMGTVNGSSSIDIVKTGATGSGTLAAGQVWKVFVDNGATALSLMLNGGSITTVACSITTPNVNVPLAPALSSAFTAVNSTRGDYPFTIGLSCDAGARINASLSFTQNTDTSNTSVINLTNAGSPGIATGVGIQLLYGSTPLQNNTNIVLKTSAGGVEFPAGAFTARYFQTKSAVTTGDANATATLNLTYQ